MVKQKNITVETRALIDYPNQIQNKIKGKGGVLIDELDLTDEFYADTTEVFPKHTFERTEKAARIRYIKGKNSKKTILAEVKEVPLKQKGASNLHDAIVVSYFQESNQEKLPDIKKKLEEMGFPSLVITINKHRKTYKLGKSTVCIDQIEGFGPGVEIRTDINSEKEIFETKKSQVQTLLDLGVLENDIVKKSLTHMIIDSKIKSDPKIKIPILKNQLNELQEKKKELMLKISSYNREEGDGWHDNAALDILTEDINILDARINTVKKELLETKK